MKNRFNAVYYFDSIVKRSLPHKYTTAIIRGQCFLDYARSIFFERFIYKNECA